MLTFGDWIRDEKRRRALASVSESAWPELQRFAEFGRVSAVLLHEISTPLAAATLTLDQLGLEDSNRLVNRARQDLKRLERYISAARKQLKSESNKTNFSLTVAIHQVAYLLRPRAQDAGVKLLINSVGSIRLYGDPVRLHQVLSNLISNAIEAYEGIEDKPRIVNVQVKVGAAKVKIIVEDYGKGIRKEDLPHIFEPFYSTKRDIGRGIGIGLAVVKNTVETEYGGKIQVSSRVDKGTKFTVVLPYEGKA